MFNKPNAVPLRRLVLWGTGLLFLLAAITIGFLLRLDLNEYRGLAAARASEVLGRTVTIDGSVQWTFSLTPTIVLNDLRIANPPWASRPDFARVESAEVTIALLPLLRGHVEIPRIVVEAPDVLLEQGPSKDSTGHSIRRHSSDPWQRDYGLACSRCRDSNDRASSRNCGIPHAWR